MGAADPTVIIRQQAANTGGPSGRNASSLADVPTSQLSLIPRQVSKQGNDDCSGGRIAQDCDAHALSIGVYLENARRSMEGDTALDDQPERSRVGQAAATERQDRKSEFRAREEIRDQIGTQCETNSERHGAES